jgi:hypothetical protein
MAARSKIQPSGVKHCEIVADDLKNTGKGSGASARDQKGQAIWIVNAHRGGKRFIVHAG